MFVLMRLQLANYLVKIVNPLYFSFLLRNSELLSISQHLSVLLLQSVLLSLKLRQPSHYNCWGFEFLLNILQNAKPFFAMQKKDA